MKKIFGFAASLAFLCFGVSCAVAAPVPPGPVPPLSPQVGSVQAAAGSPRTGAVLVPLAVGAVPALISEPDYTDGFRSYDPEPDNPGVYVTADGYPVVRDDARGEWVYTLNGSALYRVGGMMVPSALPVLPTTVAVPAAVPVLPGGVCLYPFP